MFANTSNTIEYEFRLKYGCYPYTYLLRQQENGYSFDVSFVKLQENVDAIWEEMKLNHEKFLSDNINKE